MRRSLPTAAAALALVGFCGEAGAEAAGRVVIDAPACAEEAEAYAYRLDRAVATASGAAGTVLVHIEARGLEYRVVLRTGEGGGERAAETVLSASHCEEAFEAAVVVLSLAFGADPGAGQIDAAAPRASTRPSETEPAAVPAPSSGVVAAPAKPSVVGMPERDFSVSRGASELGASRVALATGVDSGTLPSSTLYLSAAVARSLAALELRGVLRYGLPSIEDDAEGGARRSWRREFGAVELRSCYGSGARLRFSACAGAELGAVRSSQRFEAEGERWDEDAVNARLSGVLAAVLSHSAGPIRPELEVSGGAVAWGREPEDSWLVLRVSAGAAVAF